jgi:ADP-ribose pyrophosphatase YjhB (NUDIX family)
MNSFNPSVSVECVIFGLDINEQALKILVYEKDIFADKLSGNKNLKIPGSLLGKNENLYESAFTVLNDLTGLKNVCLKQFQSFGNPKRIKYPEEKKWAEQHYGVSIDRVVTVAYYALIRIDKLILDQTMIKDKLQWINVENADNLAFDHSEILNKARKALSNDLKFLNASVFELLPKKFALTQLQSVIELIHGTKLDKRNFRKKISKAKYIVPHGDKQQGVRHKPALLYYFDKNIFEQNDDFKTTFYI